ncbi:helix-turn-helix domain-containing protein [Microbacterium sp.]|uniref:helix-turn-helix domain-containing protein n=1 Tax=Microbacterium sp. TaxID=51671 RepID=UPI003C714DA8
MPGSGFSPASTHRPPPIPPIRSGGVWDQTDHLLLWVRSGSASVRVGDHPEILLGAGECAWMPTKRGASWTIATEPGTIAFPLLTHPRVAAGALAVPRRFAVPDGTKDWLIQYFNLQVTPLSGRGYSHDALAELLHHSGSPLTPPVPDGVAALASPQDPLVMPKTATARTVAHGLLRDPAIELTVEEWASQVRSSARTLRRDFLATGVTFEKWRLRCRMSAAVEFLTAGYEIDEVAARVGFASRNGFTRAFVHHYGSTPFEIRTHLATVHLGGDVSARITAARLADDLGGIARGDLSLNSTELLPAAHTPSHTNETHVLSWMYRGSGYVDIAGRRHERHRGAATWIPAQVEHTTGIRENSISLPIGTASTAELSLTEPLQAQFAPIWDDYLMFCAISSRTPLRPDGYDRGHILGLFAEQLAEQRALTVPMPTHPRAREAAMHYLRHVGASRDTAIVDLPEGVRQAFLAETGMSFARWRYAARMRIARDLLAGGAKPSVVARRTGYAHLPTFSAAFTRFHGMSPRDYREQAAA